jgi:hypothetical protein
MNKDRRKALSAIEAILAEAREQIEAIRDEEQDYYDNMPESFQDGEKGQAAEAAVSAMEDAISSIEEAEQSLTDAAQ